MLPIDTSEKISKGISESTLYSAKEIIISSPYENSQRVVNSYFAGQFSPQIVHAYQSRFDHRGDSNISGLTIWHYVSQAERFRNTEEGWNNGTGSRVYDDAIDKLCSHPMFDIFALHVHLGKLQPVLSPSLDGGLELEWNTPRYCVTIEISKNGQSAIFSSYNKSNDDYIESEYNIGESNSEVVALQDIVRSHLRR